MVRQQLVIGAALLAGAAIGFCLAPEGEKRPAEAEAEPQAKAAIADRGDEASVAALRARVKSLEAELAKARAQKPLTDIIVGNVPAREEAVSRDEVPRRGPERFRAEMERLKKEEPERYREIVDTDDWEIGIRTVTPWSICQNWPKKVEEPTLPGIVTEPSKEGA